MLIDIIVAEYADFIKVASLIHAILREQKKGYSIRFRFIYTGSHNDTYIMSGILSQLSLPKPNLNLELGASMTESEQIATLLVRYEKVLTMGKPNLILTISDSNASVACAIAAKKLYNTWMGHIDAGQQTDSLPGSNINRVLVDSITDFYFTPSHSANDNLRRMGVTDERIFFVGNTRIDTLMKLLKNAKPDSLWEQIGLKQGAYFVLLLHHSRNMKPLVLKDLLVNIVRSSQKLPVIMAVNPANAKMAAAAGIKSPNLHLINIPEYPQLVYLLANAAAVITDHNYTQEDATVLHIPCITIGDSKERPETYSVGTNILISELDGLGPAFEKIMKKGWKKGNIPYLWDGEAAERILAVIKNLDSEIVK